MTNPTFKSIALIARSEVRLLMIEVARELRERYGATIHLFCFGPQEVVFYEKKNENGLFDTIVDAEILLSSTRTLNLNEADVFARGRSMEETLPRTYNSVAVGNRHLGRGYSLGGFFHPRSRYSDETSYVQLVHAYSETLEFWEQKFRELNITLVVNGPVESSVVARKMNIQFRALAGARLENRHYWAVNEYYDDPRVAKKFMSLGVAEESPKLMPYFAHTVNRDLFLAEGARFRTMVKNIALQIARHIYWRLRGYAKARSYFLTSELNYYYRIWADFRKIKRMTIPLSSMEGKSFVFYPLHLEPEAALQVLSPEYFFQLSSIAAISRDLPVGYYLAVKETFAGVGRRPQNFYEQIAEFKNVVLLDTMELGANIVRHAAAVSTINGTAGLEAAVEGKPAIVFGKHNLYECLPHVHRIDDESQLKEILHKCLVEPVDVEANRKAGSRFVQVLRELSFDLGGYDFRNMSNYEQSAVISTVESLSESLNLPACADDPVSQR